MEKNSCKKRIAVYPGTFDPLTNGHVSLVRRGLEVFDQVVVAVAHDTPKAPLFTLEERLEMVREVFAPEPRVMAEGFRGLLVEYARAKGARVILRGLRAVSDFEYELQLALMNRKLDRALQTMFLMTDHKWLFLSSSIIKEAARLDGDIQGLVPEPVLRRLREKYAPGSAS